MPRLAAAAAAAAADVGAGHSTKPLAHNSSAPRPRAWLSHILTSLPCCIALVERQQAGPIGATQALQDACYMPGFWRPPHHSLHMMSGERSSGVLRGAAATPLVPLPDTPVLPAHTERASFDGGHADALKLLSHMECVPQRGAARCRCAATQVSSATGTPDQ